ncbi:hypothetical protein [Neorhodopirellula lusitana]|nr:hypothetical protein [Neorhodopirellula lusitana]
MSQPTTTQVNGGANLAGENARSTANRVAHSAAEATQDCAEYYVSEPAKDLFGLAKDYAKEKPDVAAMWAFGLGVIVGWKLKP